MTTARVTEVSPSMQPIPPTPLTSEQLRVLCRAAMFGLQAGLLERWEGSEIDLLRGGLLASLSAVQRAQLHRDELVALQLTNAVIHATRTRNTGYAGHTVRSFCDALLALLHPDDELAMVDFGCFASRQIVIDRDDFGAVEIREMRRQS